MKIHIVFVGKTDGDLFRKAIADYAGRISHFIQCSVEELPDVRNTKSLTEKEQKEKEGEAVMRALQPGDHLVLLDERGEEMTSHEFADYIDRKMMKVPKRLVFLIGGPYGFSPQIYQAAQGKISLSRMTFSHQMVRLFLVEQIYRAFTILRGLPYHHD